MTALSPDELTALRAYAQGRRADLPATRLSAARVRLAAAGLVRDCALSESPMYVTATDAGLRVLAQLDRPAPEPMTQGAADWIYREVLTSAYRRSVGAEGQGQQLGSAAVRVCPCQWGPCGHCTASRHEQCPHHDWRPPGAPAARILDRRGGVVAQVWTTGKPCAWRCPCGCPRPLVTAARVAPPARSAAGLRTGSTVRSDASDQLDLLSLIGGTQ